MSHHHSQRSASEAISGLLGLLRVRQWVKNGFVFAPLLFTGQFNQAHSTLMTLGAFALFCVASSATYVVNDWRDMKYDRAHPTKRFSRPMASGLVTPFMAACLLAVLYAILLAGALTQPRMSPAIAIYLALNLAYSFGLKEQPVIDIFIIASGFVLRVYAGAQALSVQVSSWMFVTTLCLALYLASVKRRQELMLAGGDARKVLGKYSLSLVDRFAQMAATSALVFYSLFVVTGHTSLIVTIPLVLFGLFRYWYIVDCQDAGESPTDALLRDWQLLLAVLAWAALCAYRLWS